MLGTRNKVAYLRSVARDSPVLFRLIFDNFLLCRPLGEPTPLLACFAPLFSAALFARGLPVAISNNLLGESSLVSALPGMFDRVAECGSSSRASRLRSPLTGVSSPPVDRGERRGLEKLGVVEEGAMTGTSREQNAVQFFTIKGLCWTQRRWRQTYRVRIHKFRIQVHVW